MQMKIKYIVWDYNIQWNKYIYLNNNYIMLFIIYYIKYKKYRIRIQKIKKYNLLILRI